MSFTISANTLFHFTGSLKNLISILKREFRPHYCLEDFSPVLLNVSEDEEDLEIAIPMVSFCDLPLSLIGKHLVTYGDYGIGMSKDWGQRNGISPISYLYRDSLAAKTFSRLISTALSLGNEEDPYGPMGPHLAGLISYVKPYEGSFWRTSGVIPEVRFYDEREWRFVPEGVDKLNLWKQQFMNEAMRKDANEKIGKKIKLSFEPNDIKYLVVRREDEIVPFVMQLERLKSKYSVEDVKLLASRVISAEQIRNDF